MTSERTDRVGPRPAVSRCHGGQRPADGDERPSGEVAALEVRARQLQHQAEPLQGEQRSVLPEERHRERGPRESGPVAQQRSEGHPGGHAAERPGEEPCRLVLPGAHLPSAGQSVRGGLGAHARRAARAGLRQGHRRLSPERVGGVGQGGEQVRGGSEHRLRARAVPPGGNDLSRVADHVLSDGVDHEREGAGRQRRLLLRPGRCRGGQRHRHRGRQVPEPVGVQPGRAAAQRKEVRPGGSGVRAVSQVGAE